MQRLGLLFTFGIGLNTWERIGSRLRELELYRRLHELGWRISLFTFDRTRQVPDADFPVQVWTQWPFRGFPGAGTIYALLMGVLRYRPGRRQDVLITNQASRGWPGLLLKRIWGVRLVARGGFVFGEQAQNLRLRGVKARWRRFWERRVYRAADGCIVTTAELASWVSDRYGVDRARIQVIPNYVDTAVFRPTDDSGEGIDVLAVGRLQPVKRPELMVEAAALARAGLTLVGSGRLQGELECLALNRRVPLQTMSRVPHAELPRLFARAKVYLIASRCEGHPKSLLEAMSCGCACIGTRSPGIRNQIRDGDTGLLVDDAPEAIAEAIRHLLDRPEERRRLGRNARAHAVREWDIGIVAARYHEALKALLAPAEEIACA